MNDPEAEKLQKLVISLQGDALKMRAQIDSLRLYLAQFGSEITGAPNASVRKSIDDAANKFLQEYLEEAEKVDPQMSALLDFRRIEDVPTEEDEPPRP